MKSQITGDFKRGLRRQGLLLLLCLSMAAVNLMAQNSDMSAKDLSSKSAAPEAVVAPTPIILTGAANCAKLNQNNAGDPRYDQITTDYELRLNFNPPEGLSGPYPFTNDFAAQRFLTGPSDPANSVSISNQPGPPFNFTSTKGISAVIVSDGNKSNVYTYPQAASFGDTNLMTPDNGVLPISYIAFCYYVPATVTVIKQVETFGGGTASSQEFNFSATNFGTSNFALTDDDAGAGVDNITRANIYSFGSSNAVTVTEGALLGFGWTLQGITCTESTNFPGFPALASVANTTTDVGTRRATIVLEQGENVTCTFRNRQFTLLAANAAVSGSVRTESGMPVRRATVTLYNANTQETRTVLTNVFGGFAFDDLPVGHFYIVTVSHGKRTFENNTRSFTLGEDLSGVNFTAVY